MRARDRWKPGTLRGCRRFYVGPVRGSVSLSKNRFGLGGQRPASLSWVESTRTALYAAKNMTSTVVAAFQQAIRSKKTTRTDPDLALVSHCIAEALALTPAELADVTFGVRRGIADGKLKVTVAYDRTGRIDETRLPPLPKLPPTAVHPQRTGKVASERRVKRLIATCATLSAKELTLVTQGVRQGVAKRTTP